MSDTTESFRLIQMIDKDALGTVHCAAWKDAEEAAEEIVLARLYDPSGLDPDRFMERAAERQSLIGEQIGEQLLISRHMGIVQGQAFELQPYLSGKSLATLLHQAKGHRKDFPLAVALFVVGRIAAGLSAAYRHGLDGENLLHGFVTPQLVRLSEEGRVVVCGLETAQALREFRGNAASLGQILPYLAPESLSSEELHRSDDVYSLGVILYELLTLQPLRSAAELRFEHPKIPTELRRFLDRCVAPRYRRIQSVLQWVQELKTLVIREGWPAAAQDLSTFLASIDERLHPLKPDTSQITADDREAFAEAIREAKTKASEEVFQTMAVPSDILDDVDESPPPPSQESQDSGSGPISLS
ncbi:MAG: protein kinase [Acidobacteriota bacterium]